MVYEWRKGSHIKTSAEIAGRVCEELESGVGLTAKNLVDASRADDAPLHNEFEWDNNIASEKWREQQARTIINGLVIVRNEQAPIRKFFNIERSNPEYKSIDVILRSPDDKQKLLERALSELKTFTEKYKEIEALTQMVESIEQFLQEVA